jgi:hypothetical protein
MRRVRRLRAYTCGPPEWSALLSLAAVQAGRITLQQAGLHGRGLVCILSASWRYFASPAPDHASLLLPWPLKDDRTLESEFVLPQKLPMGQLQCHVILASGLKFGLWGINLRPPLVEGREGVAGATSDSPAVALDKHH